MNIENVMKTFKNIWLIINASNTAITQFKSLQRFSPVRPVQLCGSMVPISQSLKCLGSIVREILERQDHMRSLLPKCYAVISSIQTLRIAGCKVTPHFWFTKCYQFVFSVMAFVFRNGICVWEWHLCLVVKGYNAEAKSLKMASSGLSSVRVAGTLFRNFQ